MSSFSLLKRNWGKRLWRFPQVLAHRRKIVPAGEHLLFLGFLCWGLLCRGLLLRWSLLHDFLFSSFFYGHFNTPPSFRMGGDCEWFVNNSLLIVNKLLAALRQRIFSTFFAATLRGFYTTHRIASNCSARTMISSTSASRPIPS